MLIDARTLPQGFSVDVDVCIIGAGAGGITLARDLSGGNRKIAVLDSGNFNFEAATQALYAGEVAGKPYSPPQQGSPALFRRHDQPLGRIVSAIPRAGSRRLADQRGRISTALPPCAGSVPV